MGVLWDWAWPKADLLREFSVFFLGAVRGNRFCFVSSFLVAVCSQKLGRLSHVSDTCWCALTELYSWENARYCKHFSCVSDDCCSSTVHIFTLCKEIHSGIKEFGGIFYEKTKKNGARRKNKNDSFFAIDFIFILFTYDRHPKLAPRTWDIQK